MLPRLAAEEQLGAIDAGALAFGSFEKRDAETMLNGLRDRARGHQRKVVRATPAQLGLIGIRAVSVPSSAPPRKGVNDER